MFVMYIDCVPVAMNEDRSILDECAAGTKINDMEIRGEVREVEVRKVGPRDPVWKKIKRASKLYADGDIEGARGIMGW